MKKITPSRLKALGLDSIKNLPNDVDVRILREAGSFFYGQNDIPNNRRKSYHCYKKAAEMGDAESQYRTGVALIWGDGTKQDVVQAISWVEKAHLQNLDQASFDLAGIYYDGKLVEADYRKAFEIYKVFAEQGNDLAIEKLAYMYRRLTQKVFEDIKQAFNSANSDEINVKHALASEILDCVVFSELNKPDVSLDHDN